MQHETPAELRARASKRGEWLRGHGRGCSMRSIDCYKRGGERPRHARTRWVLRDSGGLVTACDACWRLLTRGLVRHLDLACLDLPAALGSDTAAACRACKVGRARPREPEPTEHEEYLTRVDESLERRLDRARDACEWRLAPERADACSSDDCPFHGTAREVRYLRGSGRAVALCEACMVDEGGELDDDALSDVRAAIERSVVGADPKLGCDPST
jgi:hypothetical protein